MSFLAVLHSLGTFVISLMGITTVFVSMFYCYKRPGHFGRIISLVFISLTMFTGLTLSLIGYWRFTSIAVVAPSSNPEIANLAMAEIYRFAGISIGTSILSFYFYLRGAKQRKKNNFRAGNDEFGGDQ